jgi:hypothetical protein
MSTPSSEDARDDARRELEQRALRNVRGLVDKIDATEEHDARVQKRLLAAIIVGAVLVAITLGVVVTRQEKPGTVSIDPSKLPPIRPGPPEK